MQRAAVMCLCVLGLACGRIRFEPTPPGPDASGDSGRMDARVEAGMDAALDTGVDAPMEAAADAPMEAATDAPSDAPIDAPVDSGPPPRDLDYCMELPQLRGPATIDGTLEPGLLLRAIPQQGWTAGTPIPVDQPSAYAMAWQADALYVFIRVTDAIRLPPSDIEPTWLGDGVEIYVDADALFPTAPAYDIPGAMQMTIAAPVDALTSVARGERWVDAVGLGVWTSPQFRAFPTTDGYVLEALVNASDLDLTTWTLATGMRIGVNVGVNLSVDSLHDDTDSGVPVYRRLGQYFARIDAAQPDTCGGRPFCQPLSFCTPLLIE